MSHLDPKRPVSTSELRKFGLLVGGVFAGLAGLTYYHDRPVLVISILGTLGGALILGGLLVPRGLAKPFAWWMTLAVALSKITTPIFMGIVYFLMITPLGWFMRLIGRDPLGSGTPESQWVTRPVDDRRSNLERQF